MRLMAEVSNIRQESGTLTRSPVRLSRTSNERKCFFCPLSGGYKSARVSTSEKKRNLRREMPKPDKTTIWVSKSTVAQLRRIGEEISEFHKPAHDETIKRLIRYYEIHKMGIDPDLLAASGKK